MYKAPSSNHSLLTLNLPFKVILRKFEVVSRWLEWEWCTFQKIDFKTLEFWCLCCILMFRWINKQRRIQTFWKLCYHYQEIYDWISPLNKPDTTVNGKKEEYCKSGSLACICSLVWSTVNDAFQVTNFQGALHFYTISQTQTSRDKIRAYQMPKIAQCTHNGPNSRRLTIFKSMVYLNLLTKISAK